MTFQISVMTNYRTASRFRRERSKSLSFKPSFTLLWGLVQFHGVFWWFFQLQPTPWLLLSHRNKEMNQLLLWLWRHGEITYFWISKTSRPIIRTQMTFEISLTFILPSQNWITDICNCHLRCVTSWMSFSVSSLQISVIQFRLVKTELGEGRVDWNTGRLKHSDFLENHARLSRQISSLRSARKTDQPHEISCNDVPPFKCFPPNLFSRPLTKILPAVVLL
jgi:hypothetical protein